MSDQDRMMIGPSERQFVQRQVSNAIVRHGVIVWSALASELRTRAVLDLPPHDDHPTVRVRDGDRTLALDDYIGQRECDPAYFDSFDGSASKPRLNISDQEGLLRADIEKLARGDIEVIDTRPRLRR